MLKELERKKLGVTIQRTIDHLTYNYTKGVIVINGDDMVGIIVRDDDLVKMIFSRQGIIVKSPDGNVIEIPKGTTEYHGFWSAIKYMSCSREQYDVLAVTHNQVILVNKN